MARRWNLHTVLIDLVHYNIFKDGIEVEIDIKKGNSAARLTGFAALLSLGSTVTT